MHSALIKVALAALLLASSATASAASAGAGWQKGQSYDGNPTRWRTTADHRQLEVTDFKNPKANLGLSRLASQRIPAGQGPYRYVIDRRYVAGTFQVGGLFHRPGKSFRRFGAHAPTKRNIARWAPGDVTKTVNADGSGRILIRYKDMPESMKNKL